MNSPKALFHPPGPAGYAPENAPIRARIAFSLGSAGKKTSEIGRIEELFGSLGNLAR